MCHMYFFLGGGQSGEAYLGRVCYQQGLPRLFVNQKAHQHLFLDKQWVGRMKPLEIKFLSKVSRNILITQGPPYLHANLCLFHYLSDFHFGVQKLKGIQQTAGRIQTLHRVSLKASVENPRGVSLRG